ncbi:ribonuclease H-like domain-containing protein [Tanacetum coccineum]
MNDSLQKDQSIFSESSDNNVNGLNFFDEKHSDFQTSLSPNDDGRVYDTPYNDGNDHSCSSNADEWNFPQKISQGQPDLRRSSRVPKVPAKFNDYVVNSSKKYKARVIAKGFSQREGFDYLETFSLVVKMSTVRCMLNVAICNGWDLFQLDINIAFLYGDLSEDIYMNLPPGFDTDKSKVCKLNKSLYRLKQAPRQWNAKLTQALTEHGFVQSKFDYSLFTKNSNNVLFILLVYVDDIVVTGNNVNEIEKSSAEAEYRNMAFATCEVIWLSNLLGDMGVKNLLPVVMYCDNSFAL